VREEVIELMGEKQFVIATLFALILLTVVFIPIAHQQNGGTYDPWLDYNEDGKIDVNELNPLGQAYGTTGDPTKNVNVTNWPVQRELFPKNLILRAAYYSSWSGYKRELFDGTTTPPTSSYTYAVDSVVFTLTTVQQEFYNRTFIYQKIPTRAYEIFGKPSVTLTYNVTNSPSASFYFDVDVYLGKIYATHWTQLLYLGQGGFGAAGATTDFQWKEYVVLDSPNQRTIEPLEQLAVRIVCRGKTNSGTTNLTLEMLLGANTDYFIVDVPIVENP